MPFFLGAFWTQNFFLGLMEMDQSMIGILQTIQFVQFLVLSNHVVLYLTVLLRLGLVALWPQTHRPPHTCLCLPSGALKMCTT